MFERFTREARAVVRAAEAEARAAGDDAIAAEHLLLALADGGRSAALADAGLDHDAVRDALAAEDAVSLEAVGVRREDFGDVAVRPRRGHLRMAASAKRALEQGLRAAVARSDRRIGAEHLLLGVLAAEGGRVPRALALTGVDRDALRAAV